MKSIYYAALVVSLFGAVVGAYYFGFTSAEESQVRADAAKVNAVTATALAVDAIDAVEEASASVSTLADALEDERLRLARARDALSKSESALDRCDKSKTAMLNSWQAASPETFRAWIERR